jgi:hypothetical protein
MKQMNMDTMVFRYPSMISVMAPHVGIAKAIMFDIPEEGIEGVDVIAGGYMFLVRLTGEEAVLLFPDRHVVLALGAYTMDDLEMVLMLRVEAKSGSSIQPTYFYEEAR